jgi:hypothetical protein
VKKTTSKNLWPQINSQIKTIRSAISKNRARGKNVKKIALPVVNSQIKTRRSANGTLVARQREHFQEFLAIFLVAQLPPKKS